MFDVRQDSSAFSRRPIVQLSCAGELAINLLSSNLQVGVHMPYLQVRLLVGGTLFFFLLPHTLATFSPFHEQ